MDKNESTEVKPIWRCFFDGSRKALLEGIVNHYSDVQSGGHPRWISLEAPSGWGKTHVIRQFYRHLSKSQSEEYWPPHLEPAKAEISSIHQIRKFINPHLSQFNRVSYSLPEYMWWGVSCEARHGYSINALKEDYNLYKAHMPFLSLAWASKAGLVEKHLGSYKGLKDFLTSASIDGASALVSELPILGTLFTIGKQLREMDAKRSEQRTLLERAGTLLGSKEKDFQLEALIENVIQLSRSHIPTVIVIDDIHRGLKERDKSLPSILYFIRQLLASDSKILILSTAWPSEIDALDEFNRLSQEMFLKNRILRIKHDQLSPPNFPEDASLKEMDRDSRKSIILNRFPQTRSNIAEALASKYTNPLSLALICTLPKFGILGKSKVDAISESDIANLPNDFNGLYNAMWEDLPIALQKTLAILGYFGIWHRFQYSSNIFEPAIKEFRLANALNCEALIDELASLPGEWLHQSNNAQWAFWEGDQQSVAKSKFGLHFSNHEREVLVKLVAKHLCIVLDPSQINQISDIDLAIHLVDRNLVDGNQESIITEVFLRNEFVHTCLKNNIDVIGDFNAYSDAEDRDVLNFAKLLQNYGVVSNDISDFIFSENKYNGSLLYIDTEGRGDINLARPIVGLENLKDLDPRQLLKEDRIRTSFACHWSKEVEKCVLCECGFRFDEFDEQSS